jgi:hypothetical protein
MGKVFGYNASVVENVLLFVILCLVVYLLYQETQDESQEHFNSHKVCMNTPSTANFRWGPRESAENNIGVWNGVNREGVRGPGQNISEWTNCQNFEASDPNACSLLPHGEIGDPKGQVCTVDEGWARN